MYLCPKHRNMSARVRVRFAPSPTGPLHIGGVRTALFNYLFAKKHKGDFILRIEDTDQNRYVPEAEEYIVDTLNWCGIPFDEGPGRDRGHAPYRQSERQFIYQEYAEKLLASGKAYYAFDSSASLDAHRKAHESKGKTFIYNWHNRLKLDNSLSLDSVTLDKRLASGEEYVIRFLTPSNQEIKMHDIVRGPISVDSNTLDDKVLFKSDGMPTYHLANIVDDHLMEISHVIRGEEWLPSLALHYLLYDAFNWKPPEFAHLPLILKPTGKGKLSKRDGEKLGFPIFPLTWKDSIGYREAGYFSEAVVNFLAMLGWNPGTEQEVFSLTELIEAFTLERVHKSGARFDPDKTKWFNHQWLQFKPNAVLAAQFSTLLKTKNLPEPQPTSDYVERVVSLIKERASFIHDFWELGDYFFIAPSVYDPNAAKKQFKEDTPEILEVVAKQLNYLIDFSSANIEATIKSYITEAGLSFGQVMPPLRLAIVGAMKGPHIYDIMHVLGREESVQRIISCINSLKP